MRAKIIPSLFVVDLVLKWMAVRGNYAVINYGVSFGVKIWSDILFYVCIAILFIWLYRQKMWLILAGGVANIVSRIMWGGVVDYWNFFGLFTNNLADWMIVIGVIACVRAWHFSR